MKFNKRKLRFNGFTVVELLIVMAIMSIVILSLLSLYSSGQKYFLTQSTRADMLQDGRQLLSWISRDIKEGILVIPSWGSYTTSTNCLVLKVPSVNASSAIINIDNDFDYIIYRLNPSNPSRLERVVDGKDGVSSRRDSARVVAKKVYSFVLSSGGVNLSSVADLSSISSIDIALTARKTIYGKAYQEILRSAVKLRNK